MHDIPKGSTAHPQHHGPSTYQGPPSSSHRFSSLNSVSGAFQPSSPSAYIPTDALYLAPGGTYVPPPTYKDTHAQEGSRNELVVGQVQPAPWWLNIVSSFPCHAGCGTRLLELAPSHRGSRLVLFHPAGMIDLSVWFPSEVSRKVLGNMRIWRGQKTGG